MKNLNQIRAQYALRAAANKEFKGEKGGQVVKKVPTMIRENGFIGALAFAMEKKGGYIEVFEEMLKHLRDPRVGAIRSDTVSNAGKLLEYVCEGDSSRLREVTAESMAYLSYLRRFATKGDSSDNNSNQ